MIKSDKVMANGEAIEVLVGIPEGKGPFPTLILTYHKGGFDRFTENRIQALVDAGFLTIAPDFYFRAPKDAEDRKAFLRDSECVALFKAAAAYAEKHPQHAKGQLGIIGHCMGGRLSLLGASVLPQLKVSAVFYGGGMFVSWGKEGWTPADKLGDIRCPVIGFFGGLDTNPSPADVDKIDATLTEHGVEHIFHRYPKVGHGFQQAALGRGGENELFASNDAWAKMQAFVRSKMGAPAMVS